MLNNYNFLFHKSSDIS